MAKRPFNPATAAQKWKDRLAASGEAIKAGVNAVTESPMEAAAQQSNAFLNGVQDAVNSGKWAAGLRRVSLPTWKDRMINKGVQRIASGAAAAQADMQTFLTDLGNFQQTVIATLPPRGSFEQNMARSQQFAEQMRNFRRR